MIGRSLDWLGNARLALPLLATVALASLAVSAFAIVGYTQAVQESQRTTCTRGNARTVQIVAMGQADHDLSARVIEVVLGEVTPEFRNAVAADLAAALADHQDVVDSVQLYDCATLEPIPASPS